MNDMITKIPAEVSNKKSGRIPCLIPTDHRSSITENQRKHMALKALCFAVLALSISNAIVNEDISRPEIYDVASSKELHLIHEPNPFLRGSEEMKKVRDYPAREDSRNIEVRDAAAYIEEDNLSRTATGGFVNTIMVALTIFAFLGNGAFMVYVFWLSK